jgi:hypothetical protein
MKKVGLILGMAAAVAALTAPAPASGDLANGFQCPEPTSGFHFDTVLPDGTLGQPYSAQLGVTGGTPPYTWEAQNGAAGWPAALVMDSSGQVSGVPATAGNFQIVVGATDSSSPAQCASEIFYLHVNNGTEGAQQTLQQVLQQTLASVLQAVNGPTLGLVPCLEATLSTLINHTPPGSACGDLP